MREKFLIHEMENGITLIGEPMPDVQSGAFAILVPTGAATDPAGKEGSASVLSEMFHKGAGAYDSRSLSEAFEEIGAHRSHSAGIEVSVFSGALLGENLVKALSLYGTVLREPLLPEDELENVQQLSFQELESLEDDPSSKVMVELAQKFYPGVYGRSQYGTKEGVAAITIDSLRKYHAEQYVPEGIVIGVAGKFIWTEVCDCVERAFGSWQGNRSSLDPAKMSNTETNFHVNQETAQLQIALAYPSAQYGDEDYYNAKVAIGVLSGGMAGRLFVEVREKRGLVYRVSASHSGTVGRPAIFGFAGTTPDNAQETFDVMLKELRGIENGVTADELIRAKADIKSRVLIQEELSSSRASALVNDWWNLGRVRPVDEINSAIEQVSIDDVVAYARRYPVSPLTVVTLGPKGVEYRK